jgi:hypothetical protein
MMKDETWNVQILHSMVFNMSLGMVLEMFDETDNYPLANRAVQAGLFREEQVEALLDKLHAVPANEKLRITGEEILLLYTCLDITAKLMISHKGEQVAEMLRIDSNPDPNVKTGFEGMLKGASLLVRSMTKEYGHVPEFRSRMQELDALNQFI